jgi:hypothetical protein
MATPEGAILQFRARSNRTYTVEYTGSLESGVWFRLADIWATAFDREESVSDSGFGGSRFYRLVTPRP